jgi:hypothetical protein
MFGVTQAAQATQITSGTRASGHSARAMLGPAGIYYSNSLLLAIPLGVTSALRVRLSDVPSKFPPRAPLPMNDTAGGPREGGLNGWPG